MMAPESLWHKASAEQHSAPDLQVIACQQLTPELAALISQAEQVIFVDASLDLPASAGRCSRSMRLLSKRARRTTAPPAAARTRESAVCAQPRSALVAIGAQAFGFSEQLCACGTSAATGTPSRHGLAERA